MLEASCRNVISIVHTASAVICLPIFFCRLLTKEEFYTV